MSTRDDLDETARQVEALGRRIVAHEADVRDVRRCRRRSTTASPSSARSPSWWPTPASGRAARVGRAAVGRGHRREPHGCLEHRTGHDPLDDRAGRGRLDRPHQLHRRPHRLTLGRPRHAGLHRRQARRDRSDALVGQLPCPALHPRQQRGPDHRAHADGEQRRRVDDPPARPRAGELADERHPRGGRRIRALVSSSTATASRLGEHERAIVDAADKPVSPSPSPSRTTRPPLRRNGGLCCLRVLMDER